ncbi:hypothetical protein GCM10015535_01130 [Streptomyces gelaticus]|uniref:Uncharacterized protein n=1 Tax=Streptomyces gelaticus TaxID=285446 RepID=A0ABQ2VSA8_9ACTN|nr:hypothetical protein [Streptomyces gelaticus]GGV73658.1 hypothetical protein GCM10015535_01130 [Streptomyces gelaticus]
MPDRHPELRDQPRGRPGIRRDGLVREIGKPRHLARADVDRAIDGVRRYVDDIDRMLDARTCGTRTRSVRRPFRRTTRTGPTTDCA